MTVCIAALLTWFFEGGEPGRAIITASDRMLTAGEIEYEPPQVKQAMLGKSVIALVAGNFSIHSEAVLATLKHLRAEPTGDVEEIANIYGSYIARHRRREAVQRYLVPLGLDEDTFLVRQRDMVPTVVRGITDQLQQHSISAEAIIAGCEGRDGHLFHVDNEGFVTCHNDIGFIAIGNGAEHASSQFMNYQYTTRWLYPGAVLLTYSAKRRSEVAPGVGAATDMHLVTPAGVEMIRQDVMAKVGEIYEREKKKDGERNSALIAELIEHIRQVDATAKNQPAKKTEADTPQDPNAAA